MAGQIMTGNLRESPAWAGDFFTRERIVPQPGKLDSTQFSDYAGTVVTVTASASANATSITIAALVPAVLANTILIAQGNVLIPNGSILSFGGTKFAQLTADAKYGDTTLTVAALPTALAGTETAVYSKYQLKSLPSGLLVGRSNPSRTSSGLFIPAVPGHDEIYLTLFDITITPTTFVGGTAGGVDVEFYRQGSVVKENYLPNYALMTADVGIADPTVAPVLTEAGTDGTLPAGLYTVGYSFTNANGETNIMTATTTITSTQHIAIASIAFPTGATSIKFYTNQSPDDPTLYFAKELLTAGATTITTPPTGPGPIVPLGSGGSGNTTVGIWGNQLRLIRQHYTTVQGAN